MIRKFRVLTVNDKQYAWWHIHKDGSVTIMLSPLNDKSTIVKVQFICEKSVDRHVIEYPAYIIMNKNDHEYRVKILDPKMAGLLLEYLSEQDIFVSKHMINLDGYKVLEEMGYGICKIQNGLDW